MIRSTIAIQAARRLFRSGMAETIAEQSVAGVILRVFRRPALRKAGIRCIKSIFYHFFFLQYRAALFPGRIPVSRVDHPLDKEIPFRPEQVGTYLDFTAFWIRILGFLLDRYGKRGEKPVLDFIESMGRLYAFAAEVYAKNLSTTERPRYLARLRFLLIHCVDPHLMCIPSLHVMVVIRSYTKFTAILRSLGEEAVLAERIRELRRGALAITEAILYIKQHSVNCVSAALFAMSAFDKTLFPPEEAEDFVSRLFVHPRGIDEAAVCAVREHILSLYRRFLLPDAGEWTDPLLAFLSSLPEKKDCIILRKH
jgi:hypothetical protein